MTLAIHMDLALFFVTTLLGTVVAGFAFGLIASAIWLHIIPPAQSAPLIAAFAILIQEQHFGNFGTPCRFLDSFRSLPAGPSASHSGPPPSTGRHRITCGRLLARR